MAESILGIDISKKELACALFFKEKCKQKKFANTTQGFIRLSHWLQESGSNKVKACMEATGSYGEKIADFLYENGHTVHVVNPACIKSFAKSKLSRHKTDEVDAMIIAEYASKNDLRLYQPQDPVMRELRALYRCSQSLKVQKTQVSNLLENEERLPQTVKDTYKTLQSYLEEQIRDIEHALDKVLTENSHLRQDCENLESIPGIGKTTAIAVLAEMPDRASLQDARQLAAYAGLTPSHRTSGTSLKGKSRLSKIGSSNLRKALYFPAIVARTYNPILSSFAQKLARKGKHTMVIIGAVMRKLLHIIFGVLKHKVAFDPSIHNV